MGAIRRFAFALAILVILAYADVIVLEHIYKPISTTYAIPWESFSARLSWAPEALWWHVAFVPLSAGFFLLTGLAARDLRFSVGGFVLFLTGWEDTFYYMLLRQFPPSRLPWLDNAWGIAWTRVFQPSQSVSRWGLFAANAVGLALAYWIFSRGRHNPASRARTRH